MNRICAVVCLAASISMVFACGGNVVVDGISSGSGTAGGQAGGTGGGKTGGTNGVTGGGGAPAACPGTNLYLDSEVTSLVGKPCASPGEVCSDNNGCGGCSVTCENGVWTSTNPELCYSVGSTC